MIKIYTDGSASKKGCGFGMVVFENEKLKFFHSDHCEDSTNNREEILLSPAAIRTEKPTQILSTRYTDEVIKASKLKA